MPKRWVRSDYRKLDDPFRARSAIKRNLFDELVALPWIRRERYRTLNLRDAVKRAGDEGQHPPLNPVKQINTAHLSKSLTRRPVAQGLLILRI
jgi:hypothetical protein